MRTILLIASVLLFAAFAAHGASLSDEKNMTVLLANEGLLAVHTRGTGLVIDETHVLTCFHMLTSPHDELFVYTYPLSAVIRATPEYVEPGVDLAVLTLSQPIALARFPTFEHHWVEGDPLTVVGNGLGGMHWLVAKGVVSGTERFYLLTDARINPGNSGGPWFDQDGNVIALTDLLIGDGGHAPGIAAGIGAGEIEAFLLRRESHKNPRPGLLGV